MKLSNLIYFIFGQGPATHDARVTYQVTQTQAHGTAQAAVEDSRGWFRRRYHVRVQVEGVTADLSLGRVLVFAPARALVQGIDVETITGEGQIRVTAASVAWVPVLPLLAVAVGRVKGAAGARASARGVATRTTFDAATSHATAIAALRGVSARTRVGYAHASVGPDQVEAELEEILFLLEVA